MDEEIAKIEEATVQLETPVKAADMNNSGSVAGQGVRGVFCSLPLRYKPATAKGSLA